MHHAESLAAAIVDLKAAAMAELTAFLAEAQVKEEEDIDMMEELAPGDDVADDEIQRMAVAGAGKGNAKGKKGIKRKGPP